MQQNERYINNTISIDELEMNSLQPSNQTNDTTVEDRNIQGQENFGKMINYNMPGISRERSFVRNAGHSIQSANKRRSLALQQQSIRTKPALEIYRPPNNNQLNVHAQEFTMQRNEFINSKQMHNFQPSYLSSSNIQHSKSSGSMASHNIKYWESNIQTQKVPQSRPVMFSQIQYPVQTVNTHVPLINSPSSGNIVHQHRVKFAPDQSVQHQNQQLKQYQTNTTLPVPNTLQRSKSLTSADNLISRSIAGLSLTADINDVGNFSPAIHAVIDKCLIDPNQLSARVLMELATTVMERAIEGRRYSLPVSKLCIMIIAKEKKETFLETMLNTCRQWYNERDKVLRSSPGIKTPGRPRFTSFMSFLTEMFCQLKRRQLQLRTQCDGAPPPLVLLTLLVKCCEDCVKPPVRSLSEIECLFFVLTCIGRDLEIHLAQQLEILLNKVRDAFLNSNASAPAIRRTLLQLIELQASHWQLPGNTVLYYYPTQRQNMTTINSN